MLVNILNSSAIARVVAVAGQAVADHAVALLRLDERLDHAVVLRHPADPAVGHDGHVATRTPGELRHGPASSPGPPRRQILKGPKNVTVLPRGGSDFMAAAAFRQGPGHGRASGFSFGPACTASACRAATPRCDRWRGSRGVHGAAIRLAWASPGPAPAPCACAGFPAAQRLPVRGVPPWRVAPDLGWPAETVGTACPCATGLRTRRARQAGRQGRGQAETPRACQSGRRQCLA